MRRHQFEFFSQINKGSTPETHPGFVCGLWSRRGRRCWFDCRNLWNRSGLCIKCKDGSRNRHHTGNLTMRLRVALKYRKRSTALLPCQEGHPHSTNKSRLKISKVHVNLSTCFAVTSALYPKTSKSCTQNHSPDDRSRVLAACDNVHTSCWFREVRGPCRCSALLPPKKYFPLEKHQTAQSILDFSALAPVVTTVHSCGQSWFLWWNKPSSWWNVALGFCASRLQILFTDWRVSQSRLHREGTAKELSPNKSSQNNLPLHTENANVDRGCSVRNRHFLCKSEFSCSKIHRKVAHPSGFPMYQPGPCRLRQGSHTSQKWSLWNHTMTCSTDSPHTQHFDEWWHSLWQVVATHGNDEPWMHISCDWFLRQQAKWSLFCSCGELTNNCFLGLRIPEFVTNGKRRCWYEGLTRSPWWDWMTWTRPYFWMFVCSGYLEHPDVTEWPDTTNEDAQVTGHFNSHVKWPNTQQASEWHFLEVSGHFRSDLKPGDMGCLAISGWTWNGQTPVSGWPVSSHFVAPGKTNHLRMHPLSDALLDYRPSLWPTKPKSSVPHNCTRNSATRNKVKTSSRNRLTELCSSCDGKDISLSTFWELNGCLSGRKARIVDSLLTLRETAWANPRAILPDLALKTKFLPSWHLQTRPWLRLGSPHFLACSIRPIFWRLRIQGQDLWLMAILWQPCGWVCDQDFVFSVGQSTCQASFLCRFGKEHTLNSYHRVSVRQAYSRMIFTLMWDFLVSIRVQSLDVLCRKPRWNLRSWKVWNLTSYEHAFCAFLKKSFQLCFFFGGGGEENVPRKALSTETELFIASWRFLSCLNFVLNVFTASWIQLSFSLMLFIACLWVDVGGKLCLSMPTVGNFGWIVCRCWRQKTRRIHNECEETCF